MHAGLQTRYNPWKIKMLNDLGANVGKGNGGKLWEIQVVSELAC